MVCETPHTERPLHQLTLMERSVGKLVWSCLFCATKRQLLSDGLRVNVVRLPGPSLAHRTQGQRVACSTANHHGSESRDGLRLGEIRQRAVATHPVLVPAPAEETVP